MAGNSRKLVDEVTTQTGELYGWAFHCPGCKSTRIFYEGRWKFSGDYESPTFSPSLLNRTPEPRGSSSVERCHLFVRNGMIEFLGDCTHELAGKTVPVAPP